MRIAGANCLVTGAGSGIGAALARGLHQAGANHVIVSDKDGTAAGATAAEVGGSAFTCDVADTTALAALSQSALSNHDRIDIVCSNAGILRFDTPDGGAASVDDETWQLCWSVNVMAHIRLARAFLPPMIARGSGHFLFTVSAAGLLNIIDAATYGVTKHAALGFAESMAITHGDDGIGVTALCPQAVDTDMVRQPGNHDVAAMDGTLAPEVVAAAAIEGMEAGRFLVLPHRQVMGYFRNKAEDYERWIGGMRKLRRQIRRGEQKG